MAAANARTTGENKSRREGGQWDDNVEPADAELVGASGSDSFSDESLSDLSGAEDIDWPLYGDDDSAVDSDDPTYEPEEEEGTSNRRKRKATGGPPVADEDDNETAEFEEDEFGRLIDALQEASPNDPDSTAALSREWDRSLGEEMDDLYDDLRGASGIGKRKKGKGKMRRTVREAQLSSEVRALLGSANMKYISQDYQAAIQDVREIIRIDPAVKHAWYTLASCYDELGEKERALQTRIVAAHLTRHAADEWKSLAMQSRDFGLLQQAVYCYRQAIKTNKDDVDAIWDHSFLLKEMGRTRAAAAGFKQLLTLEPSNMSVLRELWPLLVQLGDSALAVKLLTNAFEHFQRRYPDPNVLFSTMQNEDGTITETVDRFGARDLGPLADMLMLGHQPMKAIKVLKDGARWLQGRKHETWWQVLDDDREFDEPSRQGREGDGGASAAGVAKRVESAKIFGLDLDLRVRLGKARLQAGDVEEGKHHLNICVQNDDVVDNPELVGDVADAFFENGLLEEARQVFTEMVEYELLNTPGVWQKIGDCCRGLDLLDDAVNAYTTALEGDPDNLDCKMALAHVCELRGQKEKALDLVQQVLRARAQQPQQEPSAPPLPAEERTQPISLFDESQQNREGVFGRPSMAGFMSREHRQALELERTRQVQESWKALDLLEEGAFFDGWWKKDVALGPDGRQWLETAGRLIEGFRETKPLFPSDKYKKFVGLNAGYGKRKNREAAQQDPQTQAMDMMSRIQNSMVNDEDLRARLEGNEAGEVDVFRGFNFDDWILLFMKYAFALTKTGERQLADEVLRHLLTSNVVTRFEERTTALRLCISACALNDGDYITAIDEIRALSFQYQFHNAPWHLMTAIAASGGLTAADAFIANKIQKAMLRSVRLTDWAVDGKPLKWLERRKHWARPPKKQQVKSRFRTDAVDAAGNEDAEDSDADAASSSGSEGGMSGVESSTHNPIPLPSKPSPVLLMTYGHILHVAKSYQASLAYYLRAYELCPEDPLVCLQTGIAYVHRAMQRQVDNRHFMLTQGLAFLHQYRRIKGPCAEVEFNIARAFHQIGLLSLAVSHYEKVLRASEQDEARPGSSDLRRETAYNLATIYTTTGASHLAYDLYHKYLTL